LILLDKIYSETDLFDDVKFNSGVNLVIGRYSKRGGEGDVNGVGKSTLVRLIDYALLSESVVRNHFDVKKLTFLKGHSATLQFHTESKVYSVKRTFDDPKHPFFGDLQSELIPYDIEELRKLFGEMFFEPPVQPENYDPKWFRDLMHFFIKDDIDTHRRIDPINFINANKRKFQYYSYNELLMGLPYISTMNYDRLTQEQEDFRRRRSETSTRLVTESGMDILKINAELVNLDIKIEILQQGISQFKFFNTFNEVDREYLSLGRNLTELISKYRSASKRLEKYKESYLYDNEIDENKIGKLYSELNSELGYFVKKKLNEVIDFRKELSMNRERFLKTREIELSNELNVLQSQINEIEEKRSRLLEILNIKGDLNELKASYEQLVNEKSRKERLTFQISEIQRIDSQLSDARTKTAATISQINRDINDNERKIRDLISLFNEVIKGTIPESEKESNFNIWPRNKANSPVTIDISIPKEEALGHSRFKIVAYDLTLFLNIIRNNYNFPHFLIHDGVFNGIGLKTIMRTLNFAEGCLQRHGKFQYIVTANEGDAIQSKEERSRFGNYIFELEDKVVAEYDDSEHGTIFKGIK
jgi:uncharacterized protein YydD (DUF2326 family)